MQDAEVRFSPDSPKPYSPNLEKVHIMTKCSCFVAKKSYSVILSLRNISSMQRYVLLSLRHSRLARKRAKTFTQLAYDFYVIKNVFHVLNHVHCRVFSVLAAHGPHTQRVVPRRQPHCRSGLTTLPSVGAVP